MEIGPLVPKNKIFKDFYNIHVLLWKPSGHLSNIILTCFHLNLYIKAYIQNLVKKGQAVSEKNKF